MNTVLAFPQSERVKRIAQALTEERIVHHQIDELADRLNEITRSWERPVEDCIAWIHKEGAGLRVSDWVHDCVYWDEARNAVIRPPWK